MRLMQYLGRPYQFSRMYHAQGFRFSTEMVSGVDRLPAETGRLGENGMRNCGQ